MTNYLQRPIREILLAATFLIGLGGCGGSGNPLDNPPNVADSSAGGGQHLSFAYYQQCIFPIFLAALPNPLNGGATTNTCASSGCHNDATGRGAAFRIVPTATTIPTVAGQPWNLSDSTAQIQASDIYKNFLSTSGVVIVGNPTQSLLLNKPLLRGVLHGGGLIFANAQDPNVQQMQFWISNPMPVGQDEFSQAASSLFAAGGACQQF
jgi:predicted CxxxxCH...CXXCH cytochrome family protein